MRIFGEINVHNVTDVSVDNIRELETDDGKRFYTRRLTIVDADDKELTLELYSDDFEALGVKL